MTDVMMVLGDFVFSLPTMVYQDLARRTNWRYASNTRLGARKASQFLGPGDDTINLAGYLVPHVAGDASSLARIRELGELGEPQPLVAGDGTVLGAFNLISLEERQSHIRHLGQARRFDFSIELDAVDARDALHVLAKAGASAAVEPNSEEDEVLERELAIVSMA